MFKVSAKIKGKRVVTEMVSNAKAIDTGPEIAAELATIVADAATSWPVDSGRSRDSLTVSKGQNTASIDAISYAQYVHEGRQWTALIDATSDIPLDKIAASIVEDLV